MGNLLHFVDITGASVYVRADLIGVVVTDGNHMIIQTLVPFGPPASAATTHLSFQTAEKESDVIDKINAGLAKIGGVMPA